jgi:Holliday junction DNA helicase RuvA
MIDYIKGILAEKTVAALTVEAHGVGYEIAAPLSTYEKLPACGATVKILTHFHVREDTQKLFGFLTEAERSVFRQLINVSQVGPKVALSVLSGVSVRELIAAVNTGNDARLRTIPGIGPKMSQRLVMELRGKLAPAGETAEDVGEPAAPGADRSKDGVRREAFEAMLALGYADKQVQPALARVEKVIEPGAPVEEWIRKALQVI